MRGVDMHVHLPTGDWVCGCIGHYLDSVERYFGRRPQPHSIEELVALYERLDLVGVLLGWDAKGKEIRNEELAAICANGRFVGFGSVDPNRPDALDRLARFPELGLRGLKLGPIYQHVDPNGERCYAVLRVAQRLRLPVIWHQGTTFVRHAPLKYARPFLLDEVGSAFPDLTIVIAHMGHPWIDEAIAVARKHPHIYLDVSALVSRPWQLYTGLVSAREYGVWGKLLFGSDFPVATPQETMDALPRVNDIIEGTRLPPVPLDELDQIVHRNSLELLGLA
jgi:predicted TIM-barrel fold metal-dependent hydrolase